MAGNDSWTYDHTLRGVVQRVASLLADDEACSEYDLWTEDLLASLACDAAAMVASLNHDDFAVTQEWRVESTDCVEPPPDCARIVSVDKFYEIIKLRAFGGKTIESKNYFTASESPWDDVRRTTSYPDVFCGVAGDNLASTTTEIRYALDPKTGTRLAIDHVPHPENKLFVVAQCLPRFNADNILTDISSARQHFSAIVEWVLYQAKMVEGVDDSVRMAATVHRDAFLSINRIATYQAEVEYRRAKEARLGGVL